MTQDLQNCHRFLGGTGTTGGWHLVVGTLDDGREISLLEDGEPFEGPAHEKPAHIPALYAGTRWRVYYGYLIQAGRARELLAPVISRDWNRGHPYLRIRELRILFVQEPLSTSTWYSGPVPVPTA